MVRRVLGASAQVDFDSGRLSPASAFGALASYWTNDAVSADERLGGGRVVFATFDDSSAPVDRDDSFAVANALALPLTLFDDRDEMFLYEFRYLTASVSGYRFPTIADAGLAHLFRPADDIVPHADHPRACFGRTLALENEHGQPELLHTNAPLTVLSAVPRFVGDFEDD
jgi:hypothetical protein